MDTIKEIASSNITTYCLYGILFIALFIAVYNLSIYFKQHAQVKKTMMKLYDRLSKQEQDRIREERNIRDMHGIGMKKDWLTKLDEELAYSGIKDTFKWLTTEIYVAIIVILVVIVTVIGSISSNILIGILLGLAVIVLSKMIISVMANNRDKKTEAIMLQFMNIVDNFSKLSDDLIYILERSSKYIDEPLSSQIYDAVIEAKNTGDTLTALEQLQDNVRNKHFKVMIRNLEVSSRLESNYSDIIEDCRNVFHAYIKAEKEKRDIRNSGVVEIAVMVIIGTACVVMMGGVTDQGNAIMALLTGGPIGLLILVFLIITLVASAYIAVFKVLRGQD